MNCPRGIDAAIQFTHPRPTPAEQLAQRAPSHVPGYDRMSDFSFREMNLAGPAITGVDLKDGRITRNRFENHQVEQSQLTQPRACSRSAGFEQIAHERAELSDRERLLNKVQ